MSTSGFQAYAQEDCGPPQPAPVEEGGTIQYCADGTLYTSPDGKQNFANSKSCIITDQDDPEDRAILSSC
jgi:hypothetical protein